MVIRALGIVGVLGSLKAGLRTYGVLSGRIWDVPGSISSLARQHCVLHRWFTPIRAPTGMLAAVASMIRHHLFHASPWESSLRLVPLTAALALALAAFNAPAQQDTRLPDIGSSAGEVIGPAQ